MTLRLKLIRINASITRIERPSKASTGRTTALTIVEEAVAARVQDHARGLARAGNRLSRIEDRATTYADRTFWVDLRDATAALLNAEVGDLVTWAYVDAPTVLRAGAEIVDRRVWRGLGTLDHVELSTRGGS
jgi:hypothetical protein